MKSVLVMVAASLSACASATGLAPSCAEPAAYAGPPRRDVPEAIWSREFSRSIDGTLDPALTARLDAVMDSLLVLYPAASVAVAVPGAGTWSATRGLARSDPRRPLPPSPRFQVASITKAFTAAVVMGLAEDGRFDLDAPLDRWFPDVPGAKVITIRHLLEHTNGLASFNALPDGTNLGLSYRPPAELVRIAAAYGLNYCPGAYWAYTNTGYVMLGRIVEEVEGRPFADVLGARVLGPVGLRETTMRVPGSPDPAVVAGHREGTPIGGEPDYATPFTAGSLASTAGDLVRFWRALLAGEIVSAAAIHAAFEDMYPMQPMIPAPPGTQTYYGGGVQLTAAPGGAEGPGLLLEHSGGIDGFNAIVAYVVEDDIFVAAAVNDQSAPAAPGLWTIVRTLRDHRATAPR